MSNIRTFCLGRGLWFNLVYTGEALTQVFKNTLTERVDVSTDKSRPVGQSFLVEVAEACRGEEAIIDQASRFLMDSNETIVDVFRADLMPDSFVYTPGVPAVEKGAMWTNRVLDADSYKLSHSSVYPDKVTGMFGYLEARSKNDQITFFGLQMWLMKTWLTPLTFNEIREAEKFAAAHGEPFDKTPWLKIMNEYGGKLPITIRALPEGTVVRSGVPLYTIECTDPDLYWLVAYIETSAQRAVWYPTTIASNDLENYRVCRRYLEMTGDSLDSLPFMLHDFGGRGVSSEETAQIGGAAHLVYFMGSDTISGVRAANWYYDSPMAGFSVPATEHSVQTSFGTTKEDQQAYLEHVLDKYAKPGAIVSIVLDGYDVYREAETLCTTLKDRIIASGAKVVFRPDSGNPLEVIPRLLDMQASTFGYTVSSKGFKVINHVGMIQGDGVDTSMMTMILEQMKNNGYAAQNIVFGSGGSLLQKVNRDTYKFAQKTSAILVDGEWIGVKKDPVTDPGKMSKMGRLTTVKSRLTGEVYAMDVDSKYDSEFVDLMQTVYKDGELLIRTNMEEVRARAKA